MNISLRQLRAFLAVAESRNFSRAGELMALTQPAGVDGAVVRKGAILGALSLYLDFINLFLMLLRIFGSARD